MLNQIEILNLNNFVENKTRGKMMHKWESVPKLISEFESQEIGDPFVYRNFEYKLDEFDNVPPVIPRFQFYL